MRSEENTGSDQTGRRPRQSTAQTDQVTIMARSVFHDLFSEEEAAELEMRAKLLSGINKWLSKSGLTQTQAAEQLGVTQARVSEIKNGKINRFSLSMLVRLAQRAGLRPGIKLQKAA
jgi:predicted XRE-type DNA-binding protein